MKKHFCFSAIVCVLLSAFLLSVDATDISNEDSLWKSQNRKYREATQKAIATVDARSLMREMAVYYNLNAQDINKGKGVLLGSVLKGAATVTVTYVSGGATIPVTVITSMEPTLRTFGLLGSINVKSEVESAYEAAISNLQSRIRDASQAITEYLHLWDDYRVIVINHNSQYHGSDSSPSDPAHTIDSCEPPELNEDLPSFRCPGGGCNITYNYPSTARTVHFAKCGTTDDPYDTWLGGCRVVYYTCNTKETARHKPKDCGFEKWVETSSGYSKASCPGDYRECTMIQRDHSTFIRGVNGRSMCGPAESSSPIVSPPPTPTPTDGTPNCPDCTTHCSPPCLCSNSGTCNGSVSYHACGEHETTVSGDHSLQASCSLTDANGNSCTVTNFYACQSHTCVFPAPVTVSCGRSGCTASVSSSTEHRVGPCSACGQSYWSCGKYGSYWENEHRVRTCRRSGCGNTWQRCISSTPDCNVASGKRCWAADP